MRNKIWLRSEKKEMERRTPLTPEDAKKLIQNGAIVHVEDDPHRIFPILEYKNVGCFIEPAHSWPMASTEFTILGLKEILDSDVKFRHQHIYFAHVFKGQEGASEILSRYKNDGGTLYDLEYLTDATNRRVAAFGHWAGFAGAAFALDFLYHLYSNGGPYLGLSSYESVEELINNISEKRKTSSQKDPKPIIFGAKGRCGKGANELFQHFNLDVTLWDYQETKSGGPFHEVNEHEIFINAALITSKIPPFINSESLRGQSQLKVIADVSCDPNSELNPIPIYNQHTTWQDPFLPLNIGTNEYFLMSVDNLPSTLPRESSIDFSAQLYPYLLDYSTKKGSDALPFKNAEIVFQEKIKDL